MALDQDIARLRAFNRFYTRRIGVLVERPYGGDFSLTENRVLYEVSQREGVQPALLARELGLDPAYLSRILARFRKLKLVESRPDPHDRRSVSVFVTEAGRNAFAPVDAASQAWVSALLAPLAKSAREKAIAAAATLQETLTAAPKPKPSVRLRDLAVGDVGWITHRQGVIYERDYGFDIGFEALVAEILADYVAKFDAAREQSWIAEQDGEIVGSVFLQKTADPEIAKLRLLYVEASARGQGLGAALVQACIDGARQRGYRRLNLWTNDVLLPARRIYEKAGFKLVGKERKRAFGADQTFEDWSLAL
jgi:DNA-binding MarR family transcriptional regulator/GNAT superfamily N-acetyltransferase